jgi:hypothetical protein
VIIRYFRDYIYLDFIFSGLGFLYIFLNIAVGFIMALLAIESVSYLKAAVYFLIAFPAIGVAGSKKLLSYNIINVHFSRLSFIISYNIVVLFLSLVRLRVMFY